MIQDEEKRSGRRQADRRQTQGAFEGPDRRQGEDRRSGTDRRANPRLKIRRDDDA